MIWFYNFLKTQVLVFRLNNINIGDILNDVDKDIDAPEEHILVEELVVVMEEDRGVGHGGKPDSRDPNLPEISTMILLMIFTWPKE